LIDIERKKERMASKRQLLLVAALCSWQGIAAWHTPESYSSLATSLITTTNTHSLLLDLRGGSSSPPPSTKKKKKKKKKTTRKSKKVIDEAMKKKDAAEALGDAIR
jgi:hypothetical protein